MERVLAVVNRASGRARVYKAVTLLGWGVYSDSMNGRKIVVDANIPSAFSSIFGWILMDPLSQSDVSPVQSLPISSLFKFSDKFR